jgi:hypothetical protein
MPRSFIFLLLVASVGCADASRHLEQRFRESFPVISIDFDSKADGVYRGTAFFRPNEPNEIEARIDGESIEYKWKQLDGMGGGSAQIPWKS